MHKSREGNAAGRWLDARLLGAGMSCLMTALALGEVTYLDAGKSEVFEDGNNVASSGGKFSKNAEVRVLQVGEKRLLSPGQERQVQHLIRDRTPDQLKMVYALWTRQAVAELNGEPWKLHT